jgi:hypothetical protein
MNLDEAFERLVAARLDLPDELAILFVGCGGTLRRGSAPLTPYEN